MESYFKSEGGRYLPSPWCRGPWDPNSLSGSVVISLLAFEIEKQIDTSQYMPARFTVDMYRLPDFSPIEVKTTLIRDGRRIKVIDAEFLSNGTSMARATCQLLLRTANSETKIWSPKSWDVPAPEDFADSDEELKHEFSKRRRPISGSMGEATQKRMWLSERRGLVDDIPLSAWLRAVMVADLTNPWANSGAGGLGYINSDVTLYLHCLPCDEWLGMEVVNHQATEGVVFGECYLYDRKGMIGASSVTGLAQVKSYQGG